LAADASAFDVVVFDEASQIPVWEAIGAMAPG
jgi:superfamily I DNA and/or RNA helicase